VRRQPEEAGTVVTEAFEGRSVLITGASGFLGSHLSPRLVAAGARVHAVSRWPRISDLPGMRWWDCQMEDVEAVRALLVETKPEIIYHLSGMVNGAPELRLVLPTFHSLLRSTVNLLTVATEQGCRRVVLVGSLEEPAGSVVDVSPASPYGAAKLGVAAYGRMFHRLFGTPTVILRTYMTYGPGQPEWKVIPSVIGALLRGEAPELSSGTQRLDWIYIDDVMEGFLRSGYAPAVEGATLEIGSGSTASIREVVAILARLFDCRAEPRFGVLPDRPWAVARAADPMEARARLGWAPTVSLEEGLRRTVAWYRERAVDKKKGGSEP
jgi:nucleoside-diphosphate-sugar epimerase